MTTTTTTPAATFANQINSAITGLLTLDPMQAAIRGGLTILVFIGAALVLWGLHLILKALIERVAPAPAEGGGKKPLPVGRWTRRFVRFAVFVGVIAAVLRIWGVHVDDILKGPIGDALGAATRILVIIVLGLAAIELSQLAIRHLLTRVARRARTQRRSAQLLTLAPVLSGVVTTTFVVIAVMMALSEVGIEIGPLLAGAGIVGLAVGFGAQTLVKDFLTGIFLILEDTVSIGDTIAIGEFSGKVEEMSLRTIKLRAYDGTLHIFPYAEAQVIHNKTKGFSFATFDIVIAKSEDIAPALDLMRKIGAEVRNEPDNLGKVLDDIEIAGVDKIADSGITLKARMKTAPGQQWGVQREYLRRIKLAFDQEGVETPTPLMKMVALDGPPGASPPAPADR